MFEQDTLAIIYAALMALAVLLYAILDGYDLGVGILLPTNNDHDADKMIASIGPFWDANETWLVLAIGLLLIAFPTAHSLVLKALYIPCTFMLIGLILRGVAFDFRAKAIVDHKNAWDLAFKFGSLLAATSQGYMLGRYVMGFDESAWSYGFALLSAVGVAAAYTLIGAAWLVMKTEGELQQYAINVCKRCVYVALVGIALVSGANLWLSPEIFLKWFSWPSMLLLLPLPIICFSCFVLMARKLSQLTTKPDNKAHHPFILSVTIFTLSFLGLAISFFPDIVPNHLTIWQAVAAAESLAFLLWGALLVVPTILAYTAYSYRVFWGKVDDLRYY
ncbi:cytochrome BD ubiquinol oxidase subunit II [Pseudoalteromonas phenolica]|uniref:Cytochrome BD ubiquinol oxidase subunit II n=1 Tax=Pseudoalteromonas phenolica TaxID=161398 RepID=A0A5R9Q1U3_9GAMM|nr:cytochrome d ubiquinol oxidase subunit II [Pseudoalteromonas phenolica]TLX46794.1 cytochrome BD ubiquinol oxidase subunit II [Pseudoalteromonas phenolica]